MNDKLQAEGVDVHIEELEKEKKKELAKLKNLPFLERIKKATKIRYKYFLLKQKTISNNYLKGNHIRSV